MHRNNSCLNNIEMEEIRVTFFVILFSFVGKRIFLNRDDDSMWLVFLSSVDEEIF
jgi:hypothetical protein